MNECVFPIEILTAISSRILEGSTWKAFTQTCKSVYKLNTIVAINKYSNHLATLLNTYPGWKWDMEGLSRNPSLPWSFVEAHQYLKWDMNGLSSNLNLSWSFVEAHRDWKWDMYRLSSNPNLPWSFVEAHRDWKWNVVELSGNPNLSWSF